MHASRRTRVPVGLGVRGLEGDPTSAVRVVIEVPARNKRRICADTLINAPLEIVWAVLSDYDRLSEYIPNLAKSDLLRHPSNGIRVEQCGSQSILGFEFKASLTMDMFEIEPSSNQCRMIQFSKVQSRDFNEFKGVWKMQRIGDRTALYYEVTIVPRGLVPVKAIEWRISEDVPGNMNAVREECERRRRITVMENRRQRIVRGAKDT